MAKAAGFCTQKTKAIQAYFQKAALSQNALFHIIPQIGEVHFVKYPSGLDLGFVAPLIQQLVEGAVSGFLQDGVLVFVEVRGADSQALDHIIAVCPEIVRSHV